MNALIVDQFNQLIKKIKAEYLNAQLDRNLKEIEIQEYRLKQMKRILGIILF
ncbi:putative DNA polymerase family X [Tupanvirus deep ocean]|uniref:DNA polymerase family X n=2 Tax=Tupanvirus TaxID=2094720 RepID=A0AC62A9H1_9VIRU|nr:putative DNA polymerase family X [Tupanvirus deep ocean]QKU34426.1 putative DNA polymerase family X [Tupanvirus deep ocean]